MPKPDNCLECGEPLGGIYWRRRCVPCSLAKKRKDNRERRIRFRASQIEVPNLVQRGVSHAQRSAHKAVEQAIKSGKIDRQPCCVCGAHDGVEAHHEDYTKPLDVIWFCVQHHKERHKELRKLPPAERLARGFSCKAGTSAPVHG